MNKWEVCIRGNARKSWLCRPSVTELPSVHDSGLQYPAPGAPEVAAEVVEMVIPVVQLSINVLKPLEYHLDLAARLAPLRDRGVLIVASGNVVHNLRLVDTTKADFDWAQCFDDAVHDQLARDPANILSVTGHRDYSRAVPTPDHFVPLLYFAGVAEKEEPPRAVMRVYAMASLSMTCYAAGLDVSLADKGASPGPLPGGIPPEHTNT